MEETEKPEFWESAFIEKKEMWGFEPAQSAVLAKELFLKEGVKNILIPGIGYGRNAKVFTDVGMKVTGIEISKTAINIARSHFGDDLIIYHGPVSDMPFDGHVYDAIFCHALIHLLDSSEREKLIRDCYTQLSENGLLVFTVISKDAPTYGQGRPIGKDRFEQFGGVNMFFYDEESIHEEFGKAGLVEIQEVKENFPFHLITCKKSPTQTTNY